MPLDAKEQEIVLNAMLAIVEERARTSDRINDLMREAVKLRLANNKLEQAIEQLNTLVGKQRPIEEIVGEIGPTAPPKEGGD